MIALEVRVLGADRIQTNLGALPLKLRAKLAQAIGTSVSELEAAARAGVRRGATGRTAASIGSSVREYPNAVRGTVFASWYIARFLESGVSASAEKVKGYIRRRVGMTSTRSKTKVANLIQVRSYTRSVRIPPKPFMRPAFQSRRALIEERIAAAVADATAEAAR